MANIHDSIVDTIGSTPLVRLNRLATDLPGRIVVKLESFNPAGSVKDRIAKSIVEAAEQSGQLKPGGTIVEATSGNTGIALAAVGSARGYRVIIAMPSSMSIERRVLIKAYGGELLLTDPSKGMKGAVEAAEEIASSNKNTIVARQFENKANPYAHYHHTGPEIWSDTDGKIDILVGGFGTGGTISGAGKYLKEQNHKIDVIGIEPQESPLVSEGKAGPHVIQGIGANFVPDNLNLNIVDEVIPVSGTEAVKVAKELAAKEGILVGISAGASLAGAIAVASRPENQGKLIVAILPDTGERYLSTVLYNDIEVE